MRGDADERDEDEATAWPCESCGIHKRLDSLGLLQEVIHGTKQKHRIVGPVFKVRLVQRIANCNTLEYLSCTTTRAAVLLGLRELNESRAQIYQIHIEAVVCEGESQLARPAANISDAF